MTTSNKEALEALMSGIEYLVERAVANAPFARVKNGKIQSVNSDGTYSVIIDGKTYTNMRAFNGGSFSANDIVKVIIAQNDYSNMFILG